MTNGPGSLVDAPSRPTCRRKAMGPSTALPGWSPGWDPSLAWGQLCLCWAVLGSLGRSAAPGTQCLAGRTAGDAVKWGDDGQMDRWMDRQSREEWK